MSDKKYIPGRFVRGLVSFLDAADDGHDVLFAWAVSATLSVTLMKFVNPT